MIKVVVKRDSTGFVRELDISGHAGYAEKGKDIICAAVSVTAYTAAGALDELAGLKQCYGENDGYMTIRLPADMTDEQKSKARIIMDTTVIGLKQVELSYGKYVLVVDEEVQSDD